MAPSDAIEVSAGLATVGDKLRRIVAADPDAFAPAADAAAANDLIGQAVVVLIPGPAVQAVAATVSNGSASGRPAVLARDLLLSVSLAARALSAD